MIIVCVCTIAEIADVKHIVTHVFLNMHIFICMFTKNYYMCCSTFFLHDLDPVGSSVLLPVDRNDAMDTLGLNVTMSITNVGA